MVDYYIDNVLKSQLDHIKKVVLNKDRDWVCVIDGEEGSGKSVLAMQIAKYLDPNFNLKGMCFNHEQFIKALTTFPKGSAIVSDETYSVASARASLSAINRNINTISAEMRQRNLFVILVIPSFFDLDKTQALWRCRALIHVYYTKEGNRGRYIIFPKRHKLKLYLYGKKTYSYAKPPTPFPICKFYGKYVLDDSEDGGEAEYRKIKALAFRKRKLATATELKQKERLTKLIKYLHDVIKLNDDKIAEISGMHRSIVCKMRGGRI